ncbi:tRNA (guanosine(46)-N7)-methyltransferase TrmB [Acaryochloris marina]|uniref:tRNA (guanine-N(7)-)-methyltransferase n=1 Tax=Acaryochloris marina (strain MBIC 11017) TaxID=329726 RepID=B0CEI0_ACAM1|nr:tRNA (guanosine(46)-N7)-methyltransferase TrmB [Acaryochloris marina]ABW26946.1 tRNA (guanine-N(7)-)-methyltransferase [Acaryochloris marina MBIC11017]BDM81713.1 tRNA (guanine-N(7)-)-methyltransferase [Acaryochloris marina MBIC10699]
MGVRVRQHVNPLSKKFQHAIAPPDWPEIFAQPEQPLYLDIGCARGQFLLEMAQLHPYHNFLGVEIRRPMVESALKRRDALQLTNLHFLFGNINTSLDSLVGAQSVTGVTIQFPDPWFKRRHQKRRVVQPQLVNELAICLKPEGLLLIQSDVLEVAIDMCDRITEHPAFTGTTPPHHWLTESPFPAATEREKLTLSEGLPVYRYLFQRRVEPKSK